jgi:hypothetical protein
MSLSNERSKILEMIAQGIINAEEGFSLLKALEDVRDTPLEDTESTPEVIDTWKRWWIIPLWIGAGITTLSGGLMYWAYRTSGFGIWFACTWVPFLLGVLVLALAWGSQTSPWLHVRVHQKPGKTPQKIAVSFPIPIRLSIWFLRTFGHWLPQLSATGLDEIILAWGDTTQQETPFFVDVNNGENGERVQVFIG